MRPEFLMKPFLNIAAAVALGIVVAGLPTTACANAGAPGSEASPELGESDASSCPFRGDAEAALRAIRAADGCAGAAAIAHGCRRSATIDARYVAAATEVCERGFLSSLSTEDRANYDRYRDVCARRYLHRAGSRYRSLGAFCRFSFTEAFAAAFSGPSPSAADVR